MDTAPDLLQTQPSESVISSQKLNHKKWRAQLKKLKRKAKRKAEAEQRDEQSVANDTPDSRHTDDELQGQAEEKQREAQHLQWLEREAQAQREWIERKQREERERQKREEEEKRIKEEWEELQKREKEEIEVKKKGEKEKKDRQDKLLQEATANENKDGGSWHNPLAPVIYGKEREIQECPFFQKTGACRFGDRCSRGHDYPESSCTLLFPGMYSHFLLQEGLLDEYDTDISLEYEDTETYRHFVDFYDDVLPEFRRAGKVVQFKVSCNYEPHLRGNVYIQYRSEEEAMKGFALFNGRFFGGKQLSCQYTSVRRWKNAICGLFDRKKCPKGKNCNFLHVFRNPGQEFWSADRDLVDLEDERTNSRQHRSHHRHSAHRYDNYYRHKSYSEDRHFSRSRSYRRSRSRSASRSPERYRSSSRLKRRSRSRERKRSRSRDRSRSRERLRSHSSSDSDSQMKGSKSERKERRSHSSRSKHKKHKKKKKSHKEEKSAEMDDKYKGKNGHKPSPEETKNSLVNSNHMDSSEKDNNIDSD